MYTSTGIPILFCPPHETFEEYIDRALYLENMFTFDDEELSFVHSKHK